VRTLLRETILEKGRKPAKRRNQGKAAISAF